MDQRRMHQVFEVGVLLKGANGALECLAGLALALVSTGSIVSLIRMLAQEQFIEGPHDFIANHLMNFANNFSVSNRNFYAFYLIGHGAVKLFLVVGLLRNKVWAYPVSLFVLSLFIVYQVYRFSYTHSVGLIALTAFDLVVVGLIWHEYGVMRRHRMAG
jgi:uncharacterized membrane protein